MLRYRIAQTMIFETIDGAIENVKILICTMGNLSLPVNRARRAVLGIGIETFGTGF
jgi:hypothetical protein